MDNLPLHKDMIIKTIKDNMETLNKIFSRGKMTYNKVEAVEDLNSLIFIKEVAILGRSKKVVTCLPYNKS